MNWNLASLEGNIIIILIKKLIGLFEGATFSVLTRLQQPELDSTCTFSHGQPGIMVLVLVKVIVILMVMVIGLLLGNCYCYGHDGAPATQLIFVFV